MLLLKNKLKKMIKSILKRKGRIKKIIFFLFFFFNILSFSYGQKFDKIVYTHLDSVGFNNDDYSYYSNRDTLLFVFDQSINSQISVKSIKYNSIQLLRKFYRASNGTSYVLVPFNLREKFLYVSYKKRNKNCRVKFVIKNSSTVYYCSYVKNTWVIDMCMYERLLN